MTVARRLTVLLLLSGALSSAAAPPARRPNLVLAFSDDTGWGDPSCFGNPSVLTPGIDLLAREGERWQPQSVPARARLR